jgi:predicted  nucleic acid-binding Zn-ribbon protein
MLVGTADGELDIDTFNARIDSLESNLSVNLSDKVAELQQQLQQMAASQQETSTLLQQLLQDVQAELDEVKQGKGASAIRQVQRCFMLPVTAIQ